MSQSPKKLPSSTTARVVALLLVTDIAFLGLIASTIYDTALFRSIFMAITVFLVAGLVVYAIHLFRHGGQKEIIFAIGRIGWLTVSLIFWAIGAGLVIFVFGYGISLATPAPAAAPILLYAVAFLGVLLMAWSSAKKAIRRRRMLLVLNCLEKSIRLDLPLPGMIAAAAQGETGLLRQRLLSLHDHLDRGEPLDRALALAVPEISPTVLRAIAAGIHMNCLEPVLHGILRRRLEEYTPTRPSLGFYWIYPVIIVAVTSLIMIVVVPKYEGIFRDFHLELPFVTNLLLRCCRDPVLVWFILIVTLIPACRAVLMLFPSYRPVSSFGGIVADQIIWWTPFVGSFARDRGMADLCDIISAGVRTGHPLDESLREAAGAQASAVMRYRAAAWAQAVSRGQPMHEAARYARLPDLFASMLATVRNNDSLLQVLGFLWRHYEYRVNRARAVLEALYVPIVVLTLGSFVALIGMALMQPIAMLSYHIADSISGGF